MRGQRTRDVIAGMIRRHDGLHESLIRTHVGEDDILLLRPGESSPTHDLPEVHHPQPLDPDHGMHPSVSASRFQVSGLESEGCPDRFVIAGADRLDTLVRELGQLHPWCTVPENPITPGGGAHRIVFPEMVTLEFERGWEGDLPFLEPCQDVLLTELLQELIMDQEFIVATFIDQTNHVREHGIRGCPFVLHSVIQPIIEISEPEQGIGLIHDVDVLTSETDPPDDVLDIGIPSRGLILVCCEMDIHEAQRRVAEAEGDRGRTLVPDDVRDPCRFRVLADITDMIRLRFVDPDPETDLSEGTMRHEDVSGSEMAIQFTEPFRTGARIPLTSTHVTAGREMTFLSSDRDDVILGSRDPGLPILGRTGIPDIPSPDEDVHETALRFQGVVRWFQTHETTLRESFRISPRSVDVDVKTHGTPETNTVAFVSIPPIIEFEPTTDGGSGFQLLQMDTALSEEVRFVGFVVEDFQD